MRISSLQLSYPGHKAVCARGDLGLATSLPVAADGHVHVVAVSAGQQDLQLLYERDREISGTAGYSALLSGGLGVFVADNVLEIYSVVDQDVRYRGDAGPAIAGLWASADVVLVQRGYPSPVVAMFTASGDLVREISLSDGLRAGWADHSLVTAARPPVGTDYGQAGVYAIEGPDAWSITDAQSIGPVTRTDGLIVVAADSSLFGRRVCAMDEELRERWTVDVDAEWVAPRPISEFSPQMAEIGSGRVAVLTSDGGLAALNAASGDVAWERHEVNERGRRDPYVGLVGLGSDGLLAVQRRRVWRLDGDGKPIDAVRFDGICFGLQALTGNRQLIVDASGHLHLISGF